MNHNSSIGSKHNPPQLQLSHRAVELLRDLEQFIQQLEAEGCPEAEAAQLREAIQIALDETLAESALRDSLLRQIEQHFKRLRRFPSDFPDETRDALRKIEKCASQLPDKADQQLVLGLVEECRGFLNGL